ncbi:hypothetical protein ABEB36_015266 [Hypothenemus hampei]|uniref:Uncharacterized protein n=1 Tax=Hypothenemus hampei TaxID=57062 RepID=A0ABD1DZP4_HYPHA
MLSAKDAEVKRKIVNAASAIRKKYLALKLDRNENDIAINKALAPLTTPLKKIAENTSSSSRKKRQKICAESSPSPSSLNVKSKAESSDTVKEEEKEEEEINKSASFLNQQQHQQPVQQQLLPLQSSDDDENNYDDAIGFDKSIDEQNLQTFLTTYPAPIQPYIYAFLKESTQIDKYGLKYDSEYDMMNRFNYQTNENPEKETKNEKAGSRNRTRDDLVATRNLSHQTTAAVICTINGPRAFPLLVKTRTAVITPRRTESVPVQMTYMRPIAANLTWSESRSTPKPQVDKDQEVLEIPDNLIDLKQDQEELLDHLQSTQWQAVTTHSITSSVGTTAVLVLIIIMAGIGNRYIWKGIKNRRKQTDKNRKNRDNNINASSDSSQLQKAEEYELQPLKTIAQPPYPRGSSSPRSRRGR